MRIDPSSINSTHSHLVAKGGRRKGAASTSAASSSSNARSAELQQLVDRAGASEEVRPEVVKAVRANIEAGVYNSRDVAANTANAIIEAST